MPNSSATYQLGSLEQAIIKALMYYNIFSYPLTENEIQQSIDRESIVRSDLKLSLASLVQQKYIYNHGGYYLLHDKLELVERRLKGNERAKKMMSTAHRMSRIMGHFPFVRAIFLSGSISKNYVEEDGDIDYFIITQPGRLWIARTILILFKKIFLFNSHKYFCVNYFIDENHLTIEEQNIYTAKEVVTLVPMSNRDLVNRFFGANEWTKQYFPNAVLADTTTVKTYKRGVLQTVLETMFNHPLGDRLEQWCMNRTQKHWNKKFPDYDEQEFEVALKTREDVSKHHPNNFQKRVLDALEKGIKDFEEEFKVSLREKSPPERG